MSEKTINQLTLEELRVEYHQLDIEKCRQVTLRREADHRADVLFRALEALLDLNEQGRE